MTLNKHSESGVQRKLKTRIVLIDLTAMYDTVRKKSLIQINQAVPCLQVYNIISSMLSDRMFRVFLNYQFTRLKKLHTLPHTITQNYTPYQPINRQGTESDVWRS